MSKNETNIQILIEHALQYLGYWARHFEHYRKFEGDAEKSIVCSQCGHKGNVKIHWTYEHFPETKGRADLTVSNPRFCEGGIPYCEMEVKSVLVNKLQFKFNQISDAQYKYMGDWVSQGGLGFLTVGKIVETPHGTAVHSIMCMPWNILLAIKEKVEAVGEDGLPYDLSLYKRATTPSGLLNDLGFFVPSWCILAQDEEGEFHFHSEHPIARGLTEVEKPFFKRNRK